MFDNFLPLYPTNQDLFFHSILHCKRIFSVVSDNAEGSVLLRDTTQKNDTTQWYFKFEVPLNAFRYIGYLNIQINPLGENFFNYVVRFKTNFLLHCVIDLKPKNFQFSFYQRYELNFRRIWRGWVITKWKSEN